MLLGGKKTFSVSIKQHDATRVVGFCLIWLIYRIIGEHLLPQIPVVTDYNFTAVLSIPGHAPFRMHTCSFVMAELQLCLCFVLLQLPLHNLQLTKKSGDRLTSICRALVSAVTRITTFSRTLCGFERCCGAFQTGAGVVRLGVRAGRRWGRGEPVLSPNLIGDKATFLPPRTRLPPQVDFITNHFIARSGAD